jgi:hypothetical protein
MKAFRPPKNIVTPQAGVIWDVFWLFFVASPRFCATISGTSENREKKKDF